MIPISTDLVSKCIAPILISCLALALVSFVVINPTQTTTKSAVPAPGQISATGTGKDKPIKAEKTIFERAADNYDRCYVSVRIIDKKSAKVQLNCMVMEQLLRAIAIESGLPFSTNDFSKSLEIALKTKDQTFCFRNPAALKMLPPPCNAKLLNEFRARFSKFTRSELIERMNDREGSDEFTQHEHPHECAQALIEKDILPRYRCCGSEFVWVCQGDLASPDAEIWSKNYFPRAIHPYSRKAYSDTLISWHEPNLFREGPGPDKTILRFIWLRSFHNSICVRIEHSSGKTVLEALEEDDSVGKTNGQIVRRKVELTDKQWKEISTKFDNSTFWEAPVTINRSGCDGAEWISEASDSQTKHAYHCVDRWTPNGKFRELGLLFLKPANLTPHDSSDIY